MALALIYLLLFISPQVLLYLYLRARLPDPARPRSARRVRIALATLFAVFNLPWLLVASRVLFGSVWGIGRIPWIAPFIAWQGLGWVFGALVSAYVLGKGVRDALYAVRSARDRRTGASASTNAPRTTHHAQAVLSRRRFLAHATYAYAATAAALSGYGIWSATRRPIVTRVTLRFPDLPPGLDGLTIAQVSDLHAGIHLEEDAMRVVVAETNALRPDLVVITGDLIDISQSYIPPYVRAFRDLVASLGTVAVMGNHDRYTGEAAVIKGAREAGHVVLRNAVHVIERGGATLALAGIEDPLGWTHDDPQRQAIDQTLRRAPPEAFTILLAHRPGAFDGAAPRGVPLTLAGHIHGGQIYVPGLGWSAGSLITKYVMGRFERGNSQLYVSRGIGVVGVPIRVFVPPEIVLLTLRAGVSSAQADPGSGPSSTSRAFRGMSASAR